jgi:lactoylglutathione lyase
MWRVAGPSRPRWTHVALPCGDLEASLRWYAEFTPLILVERFSDAYGRSAWLANPGEADAPFVLVLVDFAAGRGQPQPRLAPFAHLGIEVPERAQVDEVARRAGGAGWLVAEPMDLPPPVGYICILADPDGNLIEISHDQQVHELVQRRAGEEEPG